MEQRILEMNLETYQKNIDWRQKMQKRKSVARFYFFSVRAGYKWLYKCNMYSPFQITSVDYLRIHHLPWWTLVAFIIRFFILGSEQYLISFILSHLILTRIVCRRCHYYPILQWNHLTFRELKYHAQAYGDLQLHTVQRQCAAYFFLLIQTPWVFTVSVIVMLIMKFC